MANLPEKRIFEDAYCGIVYCANMKIEKNILTKKPLIRVDLINFNSKKTESFINFDKSTAIKFAKTMRTLINQITEMEVENGRK